jgi:hypothetical protein
MAIKNKICSVTTLKAPLNQTLSFVNYHLNIGIDHMFLFFDESDRAIEELKNYERVTCFKCDRKHWNKYSKDKDISIEKKQRINSKIALKISIKKEFNWIIHIDSDELIHIKKNLKSYLSKVKKKFDYVRFPTLEVVPEKIKYNNRLKELKLFKRNFGKISKKYYKGNIAGKSFTRVSDKIDNLGIHIPEAKEGNILRYKFSLRGRILHFDCAGFEEWKTKWKDRLEGKVIGEEMGEGRKKMINEFGEVYKKEDENELVKLYKKQFMFSENIKRILLLLGVLKKIKINKKLFEIDKNE